LVRWAWNDLAIVNQVGVCCRKEFLETRIPKTTFDLGEIATKKQSGDQSLPGFCVGGVSTLSVDLSKSGDPVAILRQGVAMWITNLQ
jgi:hypothetical protein